MQKILGDLGVRENFSRFIASCRNCHSGGSLRRLTILLLALLLANRAGSPTAALKRKPREGSMPRSVVASMARVYIYASKYKSFLVI